MRGGSTILQLQGRLGRLGLDKSFGWWTCWMTTTTHKGTEVILSVLCTLYSVLQTAWSQQVLVRSLFVARIPGSRIPGLPVISSVAIRRQSLTG